MRSSDARWEAAQWLLAEGLVRVDWSLRSGLRGLRATERGVLVVGEVA